MEDLEDSMAGMSLYTLADLEELVNSMRSSKLASFTLADIIRSLKKLKVEPTSEDLSTPLTHSNPSPDFSFKSPSATFKPFKISPGRKTNGIRRRSPNEPLKSKDLSSVFQAGTTVNLKMKV
jgi:hypothetical protein